MSIIMEGFFIITEETSVTYSVTLSQAALSALRLLVQMGKKAGQKQFNFIHVAAARRTDIIFILQAPVVSAFFGGPLVSEDRVVREMSDDCVLLHHGVRVNTQLLCTP